jgi:hypothetical protein
MEALGKHELEDAFFHSFCYFEPDTNFGRVVRSESPDFIILGQARAVGVEVTALYLSESEVASESTKTSITSSAYLEAKKLGLPSANVVLFFSAVHPFTLKKRNEVAVKVAQVVGVHMPPPGGRVSLEGISGQPSEVDLIMIDRSIDSPREKWDWMEAGVVLKDSHEILQNAINKKISKAPEYLKKCDECWLLIGANSFRPSGNIRPSDIKNMAVNSPFHRTYFLDYGRGNLTRLRHG